MPACCIAEISNTTLLWFTFVSYMHERNTHFLWWSINSNSLTRPCVHCCRCALVATFHGRNADAVLCSREQVWGTKTERELVSNLTHNIARRNITQTYFTPSMLLMQSACQLERVFFQWWDQGKFTCTSVWCLTKPAFFFFLPTA